MNCKYRLFITAHEVFIIVQGLFFSSFNCLKNKWLVIGITVDKISIAGLLVYCFSTGDTVKGILHSSATGGKRTSE